MKLEERNGDKTKQIGSTIVVRADGKNAQPLEFEAPQSAL